MCGLFICLLSLLKIKSEPSALNNTRMRRSFRYVQRICAGCKLTFPILVNIGKVAVLFGCVFYYLFCDRPTYGLFDRNS